MLRRTPFALALALTLTVTGLCNPPTLDAKKDDKKAAPIPKDKWNLDYAEKSWGVTIKSMEYIDKPDVMVKQYQFLMEFSKDLNKEELNEVKQAQASGQSKWEIVFFDADNVIQEKLSTIVTTEGEITGVKGDAFRLKLFAPTREKLVRAEMRAKK